MIKRLQILSVLVIGATILSGCVGATLRAGHAAIKAEAKFKDDLEKVVITGLKENWNCPRMCLALKMAAAAKLGVPIEVVPEGAPQK